MIIIAINLDITKKHGEKVFLKEDVIYRATRFIPSDKKKYSLGGTSHFILSPD